MMSSEPISDAVLRVFVVLTSARARHDCLLPSEIAVQAAITPREASEICHDFWHKGFVARYGGYPDHRYRLEGKCKHVEHQADYQALVAAISEATV
jgi:hypothetical protein